jgi:hypothetical protein
MTRRVEKTIKGEHCVVSYDKKSKVEWAIDEADFIDRPMFIINDETTKRLEEIINEQGKTLYPECEGGLSNSRKPDMAHLVADINDCMNWFDTNFVFGQDIENQQALRALLKSFKALGEEGGRTVLEKYVLKSKLGRKGRSIWQGTLSPDDFIKAVEGLIHGKKEGGGRRSSYADQTRKMLFARGYALFLDLGLKPTLANGGVFGLFMKVILNDPALKSLGYDPENIKKLILEAKKTVEGQRKKAGI